MGLFSIFLVGARYFGVHRLSRTELLKAARQSTILGTGSVRIVAGIEIWRDRNGTSATTSLPWNCIVLDWASHRPGRAAFCQRKDGAGCSPGGSAERNFSACRRR